MSCMKTVFALVLFISTSAAWSSMPPGELQRGQRYSHQTLPAGCKSESGSMLGLKPETSVERINCGGRHSLVYARLTHRDDRGIPYWEALDSTLLPTLEKGESFNDEDCVGPTSGYVFAIAKWRSSKGREYAYRISYALRVNEATERFEA